MDEDTNAADEGSLIISDLNEDEKTAAAMNGANVDLSGEPEVIAPKGPHYLTAQLVQFKNDFAQWAAIRIDCPCGRMLFIHTAGPSQKASEMGCAFMLKLMAGDQLQGNCPACGETHYASRPLIHAPTQAPSGIC